MAYAGAALYPAQPSYTGLLAIDPADPGHLVISTNVDPTTGVAGVAGPDGLVHWELWDGHRQPNGSVAWAPLTSGSSVDNLRPVMARHSSGSSALLWLRGRYTSYSDYDADVVGVVRRPNGSTVTASSTSSRAPVLQVLTAQSPQATPGRPIVGTLDGHPADDLLLYRPGTPIEQLHLGDDERHATPVAVPGVKGTYTPIPGDFDGNGRTDVYWYAPGTTTDHLWTANPNGTFTTTTPRQVNGTYTPIPGDHDGDGADDIHWYAPGTATDHLWWSADGPLADTEPAAVDL